VRSHARRHAWRNQRQQQFQKDQKDQKDQTKQRRVLRSNDGNQSQSCYRVICEKTGCGLPYLGPSGAQSYYSQCSKIREIAQLLLQRSTDATQEYLYRTRAWLGDSGYASLPPGLDGCPEAAIAIASYPSISHIGLTNGYSDPFDVLPIPLTPRLHHLIHHSKFLASKLSRLWRLRTDQTLTQLN
jgi:hypothetical protein